MLHLSAVILLLFIGTVLLSTLSARQYQMYMPDLLGYPVLCCTVLAWMISNLLLAIARLGLSRHGSARLSAYFAHFALYICRNQIALMTSLTFLQRSNQLH